MKIAILGYDTEGRVSYDYYDTQGHELEIRDQNINLEIPAGVPSVLGDAYLDNLDGFDLLIRTPGLPPEKILAKNPAVADKITSQTNEFLRVSPTRNVIGVTGTKGKGTTSTLITKMLEAAGKQVFLGGNIGLPALSFLADITPESWVVLELSSFQLSDIQASPRIAVCLMVMPEHLNWHAHLDDYHQAKTRLFAHQTTDDIAIYYADNDVSRQITSASPGQKIPYYAPPGATIENGNISIDKQIICRTDEIRLLGKHNWQNVCAAITAVWQITQDVAAIRAIVTTFTGIEHRLQLVRELDGVRYYDDSYGTAPETAMVAMEAFTEPEIVILGGQGKGIPFDTLAEFIARRPNVKHIITIGEEGPNIGELLRAQGYNQITDGGHEINHIVSLARGLADPGDIVLLSTACTSFDMFKNYKQRGEQFTTAVQALA